MCRPIAWLTHVVSAIGAINWGLARFFNFDLVEYIGALSKIDQLEMVLYAVVAVCGVLSLITLFSRNKCKV